MKGKNLNMGADRLRALSGLSLSGAEQKAEELKIILLSPDDIYVEEQVRTDFPEESIAELAETMRKEQQTPIIVSPRDPQTGKYLLQKGERRVRAARLIGGGYRLKATVNAKPMVRSEFTASQLIENIQREDLTLNDQIKAVCRLARELAEEQGIAVADVKRAELARMIGKSAAWVSKRLAFIDYPEVIHSLLGHTEDVEILNSLNQIHQIDADKAREIVGIVEDLAALAKGDSDSAAEDAVADAQLRLRRIVSRDFMRTYVTAMRTPGIELPKLDPSAAELADERRPVAPITPSRGAGGSEEVSDNGPSTIVPLVQPEAVGREKAEQVAKPPQVEPPKSAGTPVASPTPRAASGKAVAKDVEPALLQIVVRVALADRTVGGTLLLNRITDNPQRVFVRCIDNGVEQIKEVDIQDVDLISVTA